MKRTGGTYYVIKAGRLEGYYVTLGSRAGAFVFSDSVREAMHFISKGKAEIISRELRQFGFNPMVLKRWINPVDYHLIKQLSIY